MPDTYEIKITGDPSALVQASRQAEQTLGQLGQAAARQAGPGLRQMGEETGKLRLGFRDTTSATRIFINSLAGELNPAITSAITQARMLSFSLLNFRNVLAPGVIGTLAVAAGALELFTRRAERMTEIQLKANRSFREFDTGSLVTGIREANFELEKLAATFTTRLTKFAGTGAIGGAAAGAIAGSFFGGVGAVPGAAIGAGLGLVGGAGLFKLLTGMDEREFRETVRLFDEALGKLVPFEQRLATAGASIAIAVAGAERARVGLAQRQLLGRPERVTETFQTVQTEVEERQAAERLQLAAEYEREQAKARQAGGSALLIIDAQFHTKEIALQKQHQTELLKLATEYQQALKQARQILLAEQGAEAVEGASKDIEEFITELRKNVSAGAGPVGAFANRIQDLYQQLRNLENLGASPEKLKTALQLIEQLRRQEALTGPAEQVGPRPGELGVPLFEESSIPDLVERARQVGITLGEAEADGIITALRNVSDRQKRQKVFEEILAAPILQAAQAVEQEQGTARRIAEAYAKVGETAGEQFSGGFRLGILSLQESFGTFGQNMARLTEGVGNSMLRGMDDTFFEAVHGRFKSLPNIAKAAGEGVIRELTGAFSRFAMRSVFDQAGLSFLAGSPAGGGADGGVAQAGQGLGFLASLFQGGGASAASQQAALRAGLGLPAGASAELAQLEQLAIARAAPPGGAFLGMTARGVGQGLAAAGGALQLSLAFLASAKSGRPGSGILGGALGGAMLGFTFGGPIGAGVGALAGATISAMGAFQGRRKPLVPTLAGLALLGPVGAAAGLAVSLIGHGPTERRNPFGIPIKVGRDDREPWDQVEREMQNSDRLLTYARAILDGASIYDAMERARQGDPTARDDNFRRSAELFAEFIWPQIGGPFLQQAQAEKDRAENQRRLDEERRRLEAERERQVQESVRGAFFEGGVLTAQDVQNAEDRRIFEAGRFEREVFLTGRAEAGRTALARMGPGRVRAILEPGFIKQMSDALGRSDIQQLIAEGLRTWLRDRDFDLIEDVRDVGI